ncbi:MAG: hypothetical protein NTW31_02975, partial [Bacteroidetes bacterium]|nr:hypothetical protein [Bacteroidota bacterium]
VYVSDIRKMVSWYNTLQTQNLLDFTEPEEEKAGAANNETAEVKTEEAAEVETEEIAAEIKPVKKAPKKKKTE